MSAERKVNIMSAQSVVIDCFPESVRRYKDGYAIVAIDVIRATTTAVTAVATGRRCFPAPSIEMALPLAARLDHPLLVGELGGNMPYGFDMNNSPAEIEARTDTMRPMILVSSSGTQLVYHTRECDAGYVACLRNHEATVKHILERHRHVAVIGAGTRGEFREEDQMCCAWIAENLIKAGFHPEDDKTVEVVERWKGAPVEAAAKGNSAEYLRKSGQLRDLEFILKHVNDLDIACVMKHDEIVRIPVSE
jgi:2-phosphosulfolactate phosphatase